MTVRQLLASLDSRELSAWLAYDRVYRLSEPHHGAALIACVVANANGAKTTVDDFLPVRPKPKQQSPRVMSAMIRQAVADAEAAKNKG